MTKLCSGSWLAKLIAPCLVLCGFAHGQLLYQEQTIGAPNLPALTARSHDPADVLLVSLETVIHDREVCCGKDSALEDSVSAIDPTHLKDTASKLDGRHLLSDGRPIMVKADYVTPDTVNSGLLITWFTNGYAALMEWNSHVYVVHGIVYMWTANETPEGSAQDGTVILRFLLWDTRYSDSRRNVVFDRNKDDLNKVAGLLFLEAKPQ